MKKMLPMKQFDDVFIDCFTNAIVSIMSTYDESYKAIAYQNCYRLDFGNEDKFIFPYIWRTRSVMDYIRGNIKFRTNSKEERDSSIEKVKEAITQGYYFFQLVDLYYWDRTGVIKGSMHMFHPSLIIGFDDEKKVVYALEDDINFKFTYVIQEYTYEEFYEATKEKQDLEHPVFDFDYAVLKVVEPVKKYELDVEEIKENTKILYEDYDGPEYKRFFRSSEHLQDPEMFSEHMRVYARYVHRTHANALLFKQLHQMNILSQEQMEELMAIAEHVGKMLNENKLNFYKRNLKGSVVEPSQIEEIWRNAFAMEHEMWGKLLSYMP